MRYKVTELKELLSKYEKQIDEFIIVCNKKDTTKIINNYSNSSIETEFLSEDEFEQLSEMAYSQHLPFDIFTSEINFMTSIILNYHKLKNKNIVVYNSAQNGIGAGRKSLIPAFCNLLQLTCTGSDAYRVSLCRDKFAINCILKANNINVPLSFLCHDTNDIDLPKGKYLIKPLYESASIGITDKNIFYSDNIPNEYINELIIKLKQPLLIQTFIDGYEFEIPILKRNDDILIFEPVVLSLNKRSKYMGANILDYKKIFDDNYNFNQMPMEMCTYNNALEEPARYVAELLELNGLCRIDGRITKDGSFFITDVSTNPHFIHHSSVNFAFHLNNYSDSDIFKSILYLC